jgi:hypothetical protein
MNEQTNTWRNVIKDFYKNKKTVQIYFKYPQFDNPTIRTGMIMKAEDAAFSLCDIKVGVSWYAYDYVIEVREVGK